MAGCFWPDRERSLRHQRGSAPGVPSRALLTSALLAHTRCCGLGNDSGLYGPGLAGFTELYSMFSAGALPAAGSLRREHRKEWSALQRARHEPCFPPAGTEGALLYNEGDCCRRPLLDVDIVVAGFARAGTTSMMHLLNAHPEIVAVTDRELSPHATEGSVSQLDVSLWNFWARRTRAAKPGAWLLAVKFPTLIFDQRKMWRLAQIPDIRVIVMLREPTHWLTSLYNYFLQDCHRADTAVSGFDGEGMFRNSNLCCRAMTTNLALCPRMALHEVPRFWEDVLMRGQEFSLAGFSRQSAHFSGFLGDNMRGLFFPEAMAVLDLGVLQAQDPEAESDLQRLAAALRTTRGFPVWALREVLAQTAGTRGGHARHRLEHDRVELCAGGRKRQAFANRVFAAERASLAAELRELEELGSFVAVRPALLREPCPANVSL